MNVVMRFAYKHGEEVAGILGSVGYWHDLCTSLRRYVQKICEVRLICGFLILWLNTSVMDSADNPFASLVKNSSVGNLFHMFLREYLLRSGSSNIWCL